MINLTHQVDQYRSPAIRDLVWALLSPTLLNSNNSNHNSSARWYLEAYRLIEPHLKELDHDDAALVQHLNTPDNRRLGVYFERLWGYWLRHNSRYQMLAHNLQVMHKQQTLGEFDLIVHDTHSDEIEHWELAVKFYLGIEPTREMDHWFGANTKDRLDLKYRHLVDKQLTLSETLPGRNACSEQGWKISQRRLISKGRLYFPFPEHTEAPRQVDPTHLHGYWMPLSAWRNHALNYPDAGYNWLEKSEWLVWHSRPLQSFNEIEMQLEQQLQLRPIQLCVDGWTPSPLRLFVVPDNWGQHALATLT